jgi:alpha-amylase
VDEYINATVGGDVFNVGEYWTDLEWNGCELGPCQDAARQVSLNLE